MTDSPDTNTEANPVWENLKQLAGSRELAREALRGEGRKPGSQPTLTDLLVYVLQKRGQVRVLYRSEIFPEQFEKRQQQEHYHGTEEERPLTDFRPPGSGGSGGTEAPRFSFSHSSE